MRRNFYVLHNTFEKKLRVTTWTQVVLFSIETSLAVGGTFLASTFLSVSIETRTAVTHTVQVPFWEHSFRTQWCTVTWKRGFKRIRSVYTRSLFGTQNSQNSPYFKSSIAIRWITFVNFENNMPGLRSDPRKLSCKKKKRTTRHDCLHQILSHSPRRLPGCTNLHG